MITVGFLFVLHQTLNTEDGLLQSEPPEQLQAQVLGYPDPAQRILDHSVPVAPQAGEKLLSKFQSDFLKNFNI